MWRRLDAQCNDDRSLDSGKATPLYSLQSSEGYTRGFGWQNILCSTPILTDTSQKSEASKAVTVGCSASKPRTTSALLLGVLLPLPELWLPSPTREVV